MISVSDIKSQNVGYLPICFQYDKDMENIIELELGISPETERYNYKKFISCKKLTLNTGNMPHYKTKYNLVSDLIDGSIVETGGVSSSDNSNIYKTFNGVVNVPQTDFGSMSAESKQREVEVGFNVTSPDGVKYTFESDEKLLVYSGVHEFSVTPDYILGQVGEYRYKAYCKIDECYYYGEEKTFYNTNVNEHTEYKVSDIYSGFGDIIARKNLFLKSYYSNMIQISAAVKSEYITTSDFITSASFDAVSTVLDGKDIAVKICNNIMNGNYNLGTAEIDSINDKFIKALCDDDTMDISFFMEKDNINMLKSLLSMIKEIDNYSFTEGVRDENTKLRELTDSLVWLGEKWNIYIDKQNNSLLSQALTKSIDAIDLGLQGRDFLNQPHNRI